MEPGHGSLRDEFGAGVVGRHWGRRPPSGDLHGGNSAPEATRSRAIPIRGECPEKRPTNPAVLAAAAIRFDTARPERKPKTRASVGAAERWIARSAVAAAMPTVDRGPIAVLVALRAAHGDPGGGSFGKGPPSPQGPVGRVRAVCPSGQTLRRQWTLPLRPAERSPKLGPAPRDPRKAAGLRTRQRRPGLARRGPREGARQSQAGPRGR